MVEDQNNFDEIRAAFDTGLSEGIVSLYEEVLRTVDTNMRDGKDALGRDWEPIKEETLAQRKVRTTDASPMVDTSNLRATIQADSEVHPSRGVAIIGTSSVYAPPHEFGWPEAGIPRRPIFGPAAVYANRIALETIGSEVASEVQRAGID